MKSLQACGAMARGKLMESVSVSLLEQILKMSTCEKAGVGWGGGDDKGSRGRDDCPPCKVHTQLVTLALYKYHRVAQYQAAPGSQVLGAGLAIRALWAECGSQMF